MSEYVKVAAVDEVPPGTAKRVDVAGEWVAVFNQDGEFFAIADTCSHGRASLSEGYFEEGVVECPLHGARFDLRTGKNLSLPAVVPVASYAVKVEGQAILVARRA